MNASSASPKKPEVVIILLIALVAVVHVFVFSAAFPFFNSVDEQDHLDLAVRYSRLEIPRSYLPPAEETLPYMVLFGTPEYIWPPSSQPGGVIPPPPWKQSMDRTRQQLLAQEDFYRQAFRNLEAAQPPLYYSVAGLWWRLGKGLGLDDAGLLYWLRFLNLPVIFGLIWLAWQAARKVFPENPFICIAVPAITALMPQTAFYSVNNDIFAPVTFGLVFLLLLVFFEAETLSPRLALGLGLALAGAYWTKTSNIPLLAVAGLFIIVKVVLLLRHHKLSLLPLALLAVSAALPIAAWMFWCRSNFGDFTGSAIKAQTLHWTDKPFAEWWHHPLFSGAGLWTFLSGNLATFWQGEFLWQGRSLSLPGMDVFYVLLTLVLLSVALAASVWHPRVFSSRQQAALVFSFSCLAAMLAFFALISIKYDFHDCYYPSREHPYFTSGRLMLGMLIPFLLAGVAGLDRLLGKTTVKFKFLVLATLLGFMLAMEITTDLKIFPNGYNWFHL